MLPIAPLMIEHRLIERMIALIKQELDLLHSHQKLNPNVVFIKQAIDFIRFYADKTHHGKEEEILFRELKKKPLEPPHQEIMDKLIEDHKFGRKTTGMIAQALDRYEKGDQDQLAVIIDQLSTLVDFYPKHIDLEDNHFFKPIMKYFDQHELQAMLEEGQIYDRKIVHRKYLAVVYSHEHPDSNMIMPPEEKWLNFI